MILHVIEEGESFPSLFTAVDANGKHYIFKRLRGELFLCAKILYATACGVRDGYIVANDLFMKSSEIFLVQNGVWKQIPDVYPYMDVL